MIIYIDRITGDELCSDALAPRLGAHGILECESMRVVANEGDIDIGRGDHFGGGDADEEVEDNKEIEYTLNIVKNHGLKKIQLTPKEYKSCVKAFWAALKERLKKDVDDAEEGSFEKKQAKKAFKSFKTNFEGLREWVTNTVLPNFDDFDFYVGDSNSYEGFIIPARFIGESVTPTFYFFLDAVKEEKI